MPRQTSPTTPTSVAIPTFGSNSNNNRSGTLNASSSTTTTSPVNQQKRKPLLFIPNVMARAPAPGPSRVAKEYQASLRKQVTFAAAARPPVRSPAGRSVLNKLDKLELESMGSISTIPPSPQEDIATQYDPSNGPRASEMTRVEERSRYGSQYTDGEAYGRVATSCCKISGYKNRDYKQGDVISVPFHTPQLNPWATSEDPNLTKTVQGPAYSKRRMFIVLWINYDDLFCVPLYSHGNTGLEKKERQIHEFVCLRNYGDEGHVNLNTMYEPIDIVGHKKAMIPNTTVHITAGHTVACREDSYNVGRLTENSHMRLLNLWQRLQMDGMNEEYRL